MSSRSLTEVERGAGRAALARNQTRLFNTFVWRELHNYAAWRRHIRPPSLHHEYLYSCLVSYSFVTFFQQVDTFTVFCQLIKIKLRNWRIIHKEEILSCYILYLVEAAELKLVVFEIREDSYERKIIPTQPAYKDCSVVVLYSVSSRSKYYIQALQSILLF